MSNQRFTVYNDPDSGGLIVAERQTAVSFAMVPTGHGGGFFSPCAEGRAQAIANAKRLNAFCANGGTVPVRMLETPARFEEIADTKYGPAW